MDKKSNILLFHIGEAKTGTTALQHFLYENRELIEKAGFSYPDLIKREQPQEKNGRCFFELEKGFDASSKQWQEIWENIEAAVKKANVIVSAEEISLTGWQEILTQAKRKFENVQVVIYLRRQDKLIESGWNQLVKQGYKYSFHEFVDFLKKASNEESNIKGIDLRDIRSSMLYYHRLKEIEKIVGKENIYVRVYEKGQMQGERGDIISDFCHILKIPVDYQCIKEPSFSNERWEENFVEIKRIMNDLQSDGKIDASYLGYIKDISCCNRKGKREIGYFTKQERMDFLAQYEKENELVAREYLHREDGILFYDDNMEYPQDLVRATSLETDIIKTFSYILHKQEEKKNQEIAHLYYQNQLLVQNMILQYKGNRKLAYFAAGKRCEELLSRYRLPVEMILDNDTEKLNHSIGDIKIQLLSQIDNLQEYLIVVTCYETKDIEQQLETFGLKKGTDYILAKDYVAF